MLGVSHGEDVWLIFLARGLRDWPFSEDETIVADDLVNLYYNFASKNSAVYSDLEMEECKPDDVKYLEILGPKDIKITSTDEHFGNVKFWDDIDLTLATEERTYYDEL